jgi:RNA polymerase I-specific transcription initiation factor RRN7
VLERYFPLRVNQATGQVPIATERPQRGLRVTEMQDGTQEVLRPGVGYTMRYSEELPDEYAAIVRRAASWAGVGEEYLCAVVGMYERRLWRWWKRRVGREDP